MRSLVIGYGNDLRSDDGAGRVVADRIEAMDLPGVTVLSVIQLTPEIALEIAGVDTVVFVDASVDVAETTAAPVEAEPDETTAMSHYSTPSRLLEMAATVGTPPTEAVAVSIPVTELGLGMELTPTTALGVEQAIRMIKELVAG